MKVVSAIKRVPDEMRKDFQQTFPTLDFQFCHGIEEAESPLKTADIFVTYGEDLTPERIESAQNLKWIMVLSAGLDRMPFEEIDKRGILVTNVRGIHAGPMAEYAIAMLLQVSRKTKTLLEQERNHEWSRKPVMHEISGRTMVVLGTGAIPQETARLAKAFCMRTIGVSRSGQAKPHFDETYPVSQLLNMIGEGDYVVAALPSTSETKYLIDETHFNRMKKEAIFLNMGRGDLVRSDVILGAVRHGEIHHAVLDVFEQEPLPEDHPFWDEEAITITPHLSGISPNYMPRAFERFKENLHVFISGEGTMTNQIDPKRGY